MRPLLIANIQRFSTEDGPGIRTTVFFKGCPMRCPWCHNPETLRRDRELVWHAGRCLGDHGCISTCRNDALAAGEHGIEVDRVRCEGCGTCVEFCPAEALEIHGREMTVGEVLDAVSRDRSFYETSEGGVTLSGGEPLAQVEGAIAILEGLRRKGIHAALDTCGAVAEGALREALGFADLVLLDLKVADAGRHVEYTGVAFEHVAASSRIIAEAGVPVWVRTPIIPGYTATEENVRAIAGFIARELPNCRRHDLLAFSNLCQSKYEQLGLTWELAGAELMETAEMERLAGIARESGVPDVRWSGPTRLEGVAP